MTVPIPAVTYPKAGISGGIEGMRSEGPDAQEATMARPVFVGATAAATLPAALAAAVLVSAPFAGTTTAPLAHSHSTTLRSVDRTHAVARATTASPVSSSGGGIAVLAAAEMGLVVLGAGVCVVARRRRNATD
jgi:hypothetical protein